MHRFRPAVRPLAALSTALVLSVLVASVVTAHEVRTVAGYRVVVGFIDEPVYVGQKSGLEFFVTKGDEPVPGLEATLKAEVSKDGQTRALPISARFGEAGAYQSVFFPTAAGAYTFHISGTIDGTPIDESFTSSPTGFNEVQELTGGQFPIQFPAQAELVADARAGSAAASQVTIAVALGVAGLVAGLVAIGLALAARRRPG
jgi:hypothetical protein